MTDVDRIRELEQALEAAREQADQWRSVAEDRRVRMERLRQHPVIRLLVFVRDRVLPPIRRVLGPASRAAGLLVRVSRRTARRAVVARGQLGRSARLATIERVAIREWDKATSDERRSVAVIVVSRNGGRVLDALLDDVAAQTRSGDLILVVDNSREGLPGIAARTDVELVRPPAPLNFSAANNRAASEVDADVLLFVNDDITPRTPFWIDRMVAELTDDVGVVGVQLVHEPGPHRRHPDYTVQHLGIDLRSDGPPFAANRGGGDPVESEAFDCPAVTAAAMAVRSDAFRDVGGFDERYEFGAEDVDLCWRLGKAGWRCRVQPRAILGHAEGSTRLGTDARERAERQRRNWQLFDELHGADISRAVRLARVEANAGADRPFRLAITVTRDLEVAAYGDLQTARALRAELRAIGWDVTFIERYRDAWYDIGEVDAVLSLLDTFDLRRLERSGVLTIAWVRNWERRWLAHPWFENYDLVFASSTAGAALLGQRAQVLPLATAVETSADAHQRAGVVLPANHWGEDRGVPALVSAVPQLELYGKGWDNVPDVAGAWRGQLTPAEVIDRLRTAAVVVDVQAVHTRDTGSVNARVFDALAAGAVVVSENPEVRRLFGDNVPVFGSPEDLRSLLVEIDGSPKRFQAGAARAREIVADEHTFRRRAEQLQAAVRSQLAKPSFALLIGAQNPEAARTWGDLHMAEALAAALHRRGYSSRVLTQSDWSPSLGGADIAIHLKGRGQGPTSPTRTDVLWVISHPDELGAAELDRFDLVLAGSAALADHLRLLTSAPVEVMRQATDPHRFSPGPGPEAEVVFVGNSRYQPREVVDAAVAAELPLVVHGTNWDRFAPHHVRGRSWIPNDELAGVYSNADVVLNDHWPIMRRWSLVSNRVFDVLASGGCLVSDHVDELDELFAGCVATYRSPDELGPLVYDLLNDPERRAKMGTAGRELVLAGHTFDHRVRQLLTLLDLPAGRSDR